MEKAVKIWKSENILNSSDENIIAGFGPWYIDHNIAHLNKFKRRRFPRDHFNYLRWSCPGDEIELKWTTAITYIADAVDLNKYAKLKSEIKLSITF